MLCLNGFELYSRWVPLLEVVVTAQLLVIWPKREGCKRSFIWKSSKSDIQVPLVPSSILLFTSSLLLVTYTTGNRPTRCVHGNRVWFPGCLFGTEAFKSVPGLSQVFFLKQVQGWVWRLAAHGYPSFPRVPPQNPNPTPTSSLLSRIRL